MYRIIKGSDILGTVNTLSWVHLQSNGCFALCDKDIASGIVIDGTVYHVAGKEEIENAETVSITEISEVAYQAEQKAAAEAANLETQAAIAELSIIIATSAAGITE